jgi:adenine-specific DNA-methyltransferase
VPSRVRETQMKTASVRKIEPYPDLREELLSRLRDVVPEAFVEGKLDIERLKSVIGDGVESSPERYGFSWAGRRDAMAMAQTPTAAALALDIKKSINPDNALNAFIEGENLEVLKLLYRSYFGRVKLIYIDPPYNTGNDFVYPDNFSDPLELYLQMTGQKSGNGDYLTSRPEKTGRIHSAWLSMMYPRLALSRQFLTEDGVIFVSIDANELNNLLFAMNEIFGEENKVGIVIWKGATDNNPTRIATEHEYILCYAKNLSAVDAVWSNKTDVIKGLILEKYESLRKQHGKDIESIQTDLRRFVAANKEQLVPLTHYTRVDSDGVYTGSRKVHNPHPGGYTYDVRHPKTRKPCERPVNGYRYPEETMKELLAAGKILFGEDETQIIQIKEYLHDYASKFSSVISIDSRSGSNEVKALFDEKKVFDNPKPTALLIEIFGYVVGPDDTMLDFFSGSGSSAHAIIDMNRADGGRRQTISVQFPEPVPTNSIAAAEGFGTISEIGAERLRRVLATQKEKKQKEKEGLRAFHLTASNVRRWTGVAERDAEAYSAQLDAFSDSLVDGWKPQSVIWEVILREGLSLTSRVQKLPATGKNVFYRVTDESRNQHFTICLDDALELKALRAMKLSRDDLFVCRDAALNDTLAANLALQCRLKVL